MYTSLTTSLDPKEIPTPWLVRKLAQKPVAGLLLILLIAAGIKIGLLAAGAVPFNSDEAVVGLMARHILQGERPTFFYGQAYMGSLDAMLVAAGFALFGARVWVIRLVQILLYLGVIATTFQIGKKAFGSSITGLIAALLLAVPTVNVTLYTTASLGGYGEALLLGNFILLTAFAAARRLQAVQNANLQSGLLFFAWGALTGLGLWANALTLIYAVPTGIYLLWRMQKSIGFARGWVLLLSAVAGFLIGALPWWMFAARNGLGQLLGELTGGAVAVEQGPYLVRIFKHLSSLLLLGGTVIFGMRPPWAVAWLGLPLLPFILILWAGVLILAVKNLSPRLEQWEERRTLGGVFWTLAAGFVFTSFGVDPSGRYFIPLAVLLSLAAAEALQQVRLEWVWRCALIALILIYNLWGTLQCAMRNPPGLTTQFYTQTVIDHRYLPDLIAFLHENGETRGYTSYWVAYPLAFQSDEELIFVPRLPYHTDLRYTPRDDRYAPYDSLVALSTQTAYITARNPLLDDVLRSRLQAIKVTWQEKVIGDYRVYYDFSRAVQPDEVDLGGESQ